MAGKGKFKMGAEVGYFDNVGNPLKCGDYVRHFITGKEGTITQYGVVKGADNTNYKLANNVWEIIAKPFTSEVIEMNPIDIGVGDEDVKTCGIGDDVVNSGSKAAIERKLSDFDNCDIVTEVVARGLLAVFLKSNYEDTELAAELRDRGYEVKAEKTIVVSL